MAELDLENASHKCGWEFLMINWPSCSALMNSKRKELNRKPTSEVEKVRSKEFETKTKVKLAL